MNADLIFRGFNAEFNALCKRFMQRGCYINVVLDIWFVKCWIWYGGQCGWVWFLKLVLIYASGISVVPVRNRKTFSVI